MSSSVSLISAGYLLAANESFGAALRRVLLLQDYNTRTVLAGTMLLGVCAGAVGTFMVLRRRALVGDVASHAALPGIGAAYLWMESRQPGSGKWLPGLLLGAAVSATAGLLTTHWLCRARRIREDAALGITLSLYFGLGVVLFTVIQGSPSGQAAGLSDFIFGKAAALVAADVRLIAAAAVVVSLVCGLLFKEFGLLCFDPAYARAGGWPVAGLDLTLTALVIGVTVIGMQSVGLLLVVALLVLPPTAARFWTDRLGPMLCISALAGGLSAAVGAALSAVAPRLAAGAVIVLAGTTAVILSLFFGRRRGLVWRWLGDRALRERVGLDDLLRACYEVLEPQLSAEADDPAARPLRTAELLARRSWTPRRLQHCLRRAERRGLVRRDAEDGYRLTASGGREAIRAVRNHRLWELYLIHYADVAPGLVDRNADTLEHALDPEIVAELEKLLRAAHPRLTVPENPHTFGAETSGVTG